MNSPKSQISMDLHNENILLFHITISCMWGREASSPGSNSGTLPSSILWLWPWASSEYFPFYILMGKKNKIMYGSILWARLGAEITGLISLVRREYLSRHECIWDGKYIWTSYLKTKGNIVVMSPGNCCHTPFLSRKSWKGELE